jgi:uncharacterized protein with WD repeat
LGKKFAVDYCRPGVVHYEEKTKIERSKKKWRVSRKKISSPEDDNAAKKQKS